MLPLLLACVESQPGPGGSDEGATFDGDRPNAAGALQAQTGDAPDDRVSAEPERLEFGTLDAGSTAVLPVALSNNGPVPIEVTGATVSADGVSIVGDAPGWIQPGEALDVDVTWAPAQGSEGGGLIDFELADELGRTGTRRVILQGAVRDLPQLEVNMWEGESELVGVGCDKAIHFRAANLGDSRLLIWSAGLEGGGDSWSLTMLGGMSPVLPVELGGEEFVDFELHFRPKIGGPLPVRLVISSDAPYNGEVAVHVDGKGYEDRVRAEEFTAAAPNIATALIAVNAEAVDELEPELEALFATMVDSGSAWRLAIVTKQGGLVDGDVPYIDDTFTLEEAVAAAEGMLAEATGDNDYLLDTLEAALDANEAWLLDAPGAWDGSRLHLVGINADQEQSSGSVEGYVEAYQTAKADASLVQVDAIAGTPPRGCSADPLYAEPSQNLYDAVTATGGLFWDWCEPWAEGLASLGGSIASGTAGYTLSWFADPAQMQVFVDGEVLESGWTYDAPSNEVRFDSAAQPAEGATIRVEYMTAIECHDGA